MIFKDYLLENIENIKSLFLNSFVNKIMELSKSDYILYFSKNKEYGLVLSINNNEPFLKVINQKFNFSLQSNFLNRLKNRLMNSYLIDVKLCNDDNIVSFDFIKTTDTYDKYHFTLIFELFKANSNLIIIESNKVIEAFRYRSLDTKRPIINGLIYEYPIKVETYKEFKDKDINNINSYIDQLETNYLKEKYQTVISSLKRKRKTIFNKIEKLKIEKAIAIDAYKYKEYGDYILLNQDEIHKGDTHFNYYDLDIPLKTDLTSIENSQHYYKLYKKAKTSLSLLDNYINSSKQELDYIDGILSIFKFYNEDDYLELIDELNKKKIIKLRVKIPPKLNKNAAKPYYFFINDTKIAFGKNAKQNNELTFHLANKDCYFAHIKDYSGAHILIYSNNPTDKEIEIALELALVLSNKEDGDVYYTNIKNVKKTQVLGKVNLLKYETYHINKIKDDINKLISNAKRF